MIRKSWALGIAVFFALLVSPLNTNKVFASDINSDSVVALVNQQRVANNLSPLTVNQELVNAAYAKAKDILEDGYWAHSSPDGKTPWTFILGAGYDYVFAGENLAKGYSSNDRLIKGWMNSELHKKNILNSNFTETGVATVEGKFNGKETTIVVQMFGKENVSLTSTVSGGLTSIFSALSDQVFSLI